ncbi:hypothetical protein ACFL3U_04220 [Pseudomonadota bacterium]
MAKDRKRTTDFSNRALEMIMRDVLHGMEECLLKAAYEKTQDAGFEIIEIHPPHKSKKAPSADKTNISEAEVFNFPTKNKACN